MKAQFKVQLVLIILFMLVSLVSYSRPVLGREWVTDTIPKRIDLKVGEIKVNTLIFTVYQGSKGGYYYNKVSGKTGLPYKHYLTDKEKALFTGGN